MTTDSTNQKDTDLRALYREVDFDLHTLITRLHIGYQISRSRIEIAALIDPTLWGVNPEGGQFFRTARWADPPSGPLQPHDGLFYEHLEFRAGSDLMRSAENNLYLTYTGLGDTGEIRCTFDLHESLDDLLSIDRGWFKAVPCEGSESEWTVDMMKYVRFRDPVNTALAPVLLAAWAEAAWPDIIKQSDTARASTKKENRTS